MLKKFALKNYKNFKNEIEINFGNVAGYQFSTDCICDGKISKMLIYGRNATGKTNLGEAIMDISSTIFPKLMISEDRAFLNADSMEDSAGFSYTFDFNGKELVYRYERYSEQILKTEELIVDGVTIFKCDFLNNEFSFDNLKHVGAEIANVDRYKSSLKADGYFNKNIEQLPFLRWIINNVALNSDSVLKHLDDYVRRMKLIKVGNDFLHRMHRVGDFFLGSLDNPKTTKDLEDFLNAMGVDCKLIVKKLPDGQNELYFAHEKLVPFYENASSGTLALVNLYQWIAPVVWEPSFVYLDEFDAFYHYEMAENVMRYFKKKYPRCQVIMTSHNTNLMTNRLMRPDCMFILSRRGTLTALCNATDRELREGHNLGKMYISGEFERYE